LFTSLDRTFIAGSYRYQYCTTKAHRAVIFCDSTASLSIVNIAVIVVSEVKSESNSAGNDWSHNLESCLTEAENFQPPSEIFTVREFLTLYSCLSLFKNDAVNIVFLVTHLLRFDNELT